MSNNVRVTMYRENGKITKTVVMAEDKWNSAMREMDLDDVTYPEVDYSTNTLLSYRSVFITDVNGCTQRIVIYPYSHWKVEQISGQ